MYYMKINTAFLLSILLLAPVLCPAQLTVVRVDGQKVFIDTSTLNRNVDTGETFKIIVSSERLINPKTGKDLGPVYTYSAEGKITEVQPLYAIGQLPKGTKVSVGQEAVLEALQTPVQTAEPKKQQATPVSHHKTITYAPVDQEIISISAAAVTNPSAENIITLSKKGQVTVWTTNGEKLDQQLSFQLPTGKTPLTLSAAPLQNAQTANIFVTVYDASRQKISTLVLANRNGTLTQIDTLPYFVKELGCPPNKTLLAQKPFAAGAKPGNAHQITFQNGKFALTKTTLNTQRNWLSGVNEADGNLILTAQNGTLRLALPNGKKAESKSLFAGAPNRVKYKQEILKFYPSVQVFGPAEKRIYAAAENTAKLGLLSDTFGQYQNGKIHFLSLEKGRLSITDTVQTDGFIYDTACSARAILTAEVLPDGTSSVIEIFK